MNFIKSIFIIGIFLTIQACSTKPASTTGQDRTVSSESTQVTLYQNPSDLNSWVSAGRKIVIPENQAELQKNCLTSFNNRPDFLKGSPENDKLFDPYNFYIKHRAYEVSYNLFHLNPNWVYHRLHRKNLENSCAKRSKGFYTDKELVRDNIPNDLTIGAKAFQGSGFDRGHMAPSADFVWDQDVNKESFYMTNMSPQAPGLNQQTWEKLERHVRRWACGAGELEVYTGPVLKENLMRLSSCVSIPAMYFKVLLYYKDGKYHGIAFLYPQTDQPKDGDPYQKRALSIRQLEQMTGLDFFKDEYAQQVQDSFETSFDLNDWINIENNCEACDGKLKFNN
ncbi:MAG: DNA/RNA non-specific endonuclease [Bdellovibrionales bacterium]|nr:DNA/RNA non-specific endonuclease [Bdellovibrionales bacterium]